LEKHHGIPKDHRKKKRRPSTMEVEEGTQSEETIVERRR